MPSSSAHEDAARCAIYCTPRGVIHDERGADRAEQSMNCLPSLSGHPSCRFCLSTQSNCLYSPVPSVSASPRSLRGCQSTRHSPTITTRSLTIPLPSASEDELPSKEDMRTLVFLLQRAGTPMDDSSGVIHHVMAVICYNGSRALIHSCPHRCPVSRSPSCQPVRMWDVARDTLPFPCVSLQAHT